MGVDVNNPRTFLNKKVRIIGFDANHAYQEGEVVKIIGIGGNGGGGIGVNGRISLRAINRQGTRYTVYSTDVEPILETRRDINERLKEVESTKFIIDMKIAYLAERDVNIIDADDFRNYAVRKIVESDQNIVDKTKNLTIIISEGSW